MYAAAETVKALKSTDQSEVASCLADRLIQAIAASPEAGGENVAKVLKIMKGEIFHARPAPATFEQESSQREKRKQHLASQLESATPDQLEKIAEGYARLGHMFELAGQVARENFFTQREAKGKSIPGGPEDKLFGDKPLFADAAEAVKAISEPVFAPVFTMHPTNLNSPESIAALRDIAVAAEGAALAERPQEADISALEAALKEYLAAPLLPVGPDGKDRHFTVFDETSLVVQFLENLYDDLPRSYQKFDQALEKQFGGGYTPEQQTNLHLNLQVSAWGSAGDKDGNQNVKSENTLEAIALHKHAIASKYLEDLQAISQAAGHSVLPQWQAKLHTMRDGLDGIIHVIESQRARDPEGNDIALSREDFKQLSAGIAKHGQDEGAFISDIAQALNQAEGAEREGLLSLKRRAETFGMRFAHIEYRETAEEYSRVVAQLVERLDEHVVHGLLKLHPDEPTPGYLELSQDQRTKLLTGLLNDRHYAHALQEAAAEFMKEAAQADVRNYAPLSALEKEHQNAKAITYHTLQRMELARDHPDMVDTNVLAECKGTSNMLEAQLLQVAAASGDKRPLLHIAPLFEEPETMKDAPKIVGSALDNPAYRQQIQLLARKDGKEEVTQLVTIAHSDNARRSGVPGARGYIHAAHTEIAAEVAGHEIGGKKVNLRFFEGGSQSDAYRNGVRAISAMVNAFDLHDYTKTTFQGGDLVNYFNAPASIERLLTRQFTHAARVKQLDPEHDPVQRNPVIEKLVTDALKKTLPAYEEHFNDVTNEIGHLFADPRVNYKQSAKDGNISSRATSRNGAKKGGAAESDPEFAHFGHPEAPDAMRTVSFSEAFAHGAGIVPTWLGAETLGVLLNKEFQRAADMGADLRATYRDGDKTEEVDFAQELHHGALSPKGLQALYKVSPAFRDTIDKCAYGIMLTDMRDLGDRLHGGAANVEPDTVHYFAKLTQNVLPAAVGLVHCALNGYRMGEANPETGKRQPLIMHGTSSSMCEQMRRVLAESPTLHGLQQVVAPKLAYRDGANALRDTAAFADSQHLRRAVHLAKDTAVYHGRTLVADDPNYGVALKEDKQQSRQAER